MRCGWSAISSQAHKTAYLGQSPRLVGENVLYLSQVIRQVPASRKRRLLRLFVVYLLVKVDKCGLACSNKLDRDIERDGYNILEAREDMLLLTSMGSCGSVRRT